MSNDLPKARKLFTNTRLLSRQGKTFAAVQGFHDAIIIMLKTSLMKSEKDEFEKLIEDACYALKADKKFTECNIQLNYIAGKERELLENLKLALTELNDDIAEEARSEFAKIDKEKRRNDFIRQIEERLKNDNTEEANALTEELIAEYGEDPNLHAEIGQLFYKYAKYIEAAKYLTEAIEANPNLVDIYNNLGIALRKLKRFEDAERCYLKASKYIPTDSHLFFNLGRVYVDSAQWDKAVKSAKAALKFDPNFEEARKMLSFAEDKLNS